MPQDETVGKSSCSCSLLSIASVAPYPAVSPRPVVPVLRHEGKRVSGAPTRFAAGMSTCLAGARLNVRIQFRLLHVATGAISAYILRRQLMTVYFSGGRS